jgi:creatinine amidohydrolase/Fe(II)-dependent formamide hydrolase-like protein
MASDPSLAKPEDGARLVDLSVEELSASYQTFLNEA